MSKNLDSLNRIHPFILYCGYLNKANCPPKGVAFAPRSTKWFEMELIVGGEGHIETEGRPADAVRGRLFFRAPGTRVQGYPPYYSYFIVFDLFGAADDRTSRRSLGVEQLYGKETSPAIEESDLPFPEIFDIGDFGRWERLFSRIHEVFIHSGGDDQFYLKTQVLQLLLRLREESEWSRQRLVSVHHPAVMAAKERIDRYPSARFRLEEMARQAGMSRSFFCSQFAKVVGTSPIAYAKQAKIKLAKELLLKTNKSATEISYACGYETVSYFFRAFKQAVGLTPAQYRDRAKIEIAKS